MEWALQDQENYRAIRRLEVTRRDPTKASHMKRIKKVSCYALAHSRTDLAFQSAADRILSEDECQFTPSLGSSDVCEECVRALFIGNCGTTLTTPAILMQSLTEKLYQLEHPRLVTLFDDVCQVDEGDFAYWISKNWLKGMLNVLSGSQNSYSG